MRERGYNQSLLLSEAFVANDKSNALSCAGDILKRKDDTEHQARIKDKGKRAENVRGAFTCDGKIPYASLIILIDDVITTGSTIAEARKTLQNSGAKYVYVVALAH
jgi:predicted amidophosphoribosyltransferase